MSDNNNNNNEEEEDDLFGSDDESENTADLIAASKDQPKKTTATTTKSKPPVASIQKKTDGDDDDDGGGLFDSDSDDDEEEDTKKGKKKSTITAMKASALSKRQRLEALAGRRHKQDDPKKTSFAAAASKDATKKKASGDGYESEESFDSATFERTAEDDAFLDTTGEDADAVNELYAEQKFDDDDEERRPKKKQKRKGEPDDGDDVVPENPIMAAVHRMKKKKREKKALTEIEDEIKVFLNNMDMAAEEDEQSMSKRKPATRKLALLVNFLDMMKRRDYQRLLLDFDMLTVVKRWIQPLPDGKLGNITVRQKLLEAIATMSTGETGITSNDLKRSELGKTVMILYKHRDETPAMKRQLKALIEQWSRPIFAKSGNMRDLDRVQRGSGLSMGGNPAAASTQSSKQRTRSEQQQDLQDLIRSGKKSKTELTSSRVQVPYSRGFAYSVRPESRATMPSPQKSAAAASDDTRGKLSKRMTEKGRAISKNQRSANISIEGRVTKG